jgi:hypothetical protein
MSYSGYLAPHAGKIIWWARKGKHPKEIADILIGMGVRSPWADISYWSASSNHRAMVAVVKYVIRGGPPPKQNKPKWQVWTPESQEAEFQREYANS